MTSILDKVGEQSRRGQFGRFRPTTPQEFFALRLAAKLGDSGAAQHYLKLTGQYSQGQLLGAYRSALNSPDQSDVARRFHVELDSSREANADPALRGRLAAIQITQRAVSLAILVDDHLEYAQTRQLSSSPEQAIRSAVGFISRIVGKFSIRSAAMEIVGDRPEIHRSQVHQAVATALNEQAVGIVEVSRAELFTAFACPPVRSVAELCYIVSRIWPVLDSEPGGPWTHVAAALGLYVQTERLFQKQ